MLFSSCTRENSRKSVPQGLKAILICPVDVRAEARTYPTANFSAACLSCRTSIKTLGLFPDSHTDFKAPEVLVSDWKEGKQSPSRSQGLAIDALGEFIECVTVDGITQARFSRRHHVALFVDAELVFEVRAVSILGRKWHLKPIGIRQR
jgi:hypothetical protein